VRKLFKSYIHLYYVWNFLNDLDLTISERCAIAVEVKKT